MGLKRHNWRCRCSTSKIWKCTNSNDRWDSKDITDDNNFKPRVSPAFPLPVLKETEATFYQKPLFQVSFEIILLSAVIITILKKPKTITKPKTPFYQKPLELETPFYQKPQLQNILLIIGIVFFLITIITGKSSDSGFIIAVTGLITSITGFILAIKK